jgi:glutamyl-tRNA synthetase
MNLIGRMGVKNGQVLWPLRSALTGKKYSPGVFEVAWALGKAESLRRIKKAIDKLEKENM